MNKPDKNLPPELASLEAKLGELKPSPGRLDRDRLMYELGKAEAVSKNRNPKASTGVPLKWTLGLTVMSNVVVAVLMFLILQASHSTVPSNTLPHEPNRQAEVAQDDKTDQTPEVVKPNRSEPPTESHGRWENLLVQWFGIPSTPRPYHLSRSSFQDLDDDIISYGPYSRMIANDRSMPRPVIVTEQEKPTSNQPVNRNELLQKYLDNDWKN